MRKIGRYLMAASLALTLVGCVMDDAALLESDGREPETLQSDELSGEPEATQEIEFPPDGHVAVKSEYSTECPSLPPAGSYQNTCNYITVACDRSYMYAYCRRYNGTWMWSPKLWNPYRCNGFIANIDGSLRCQL